MLVSLSVLVGEEGSITEGGKRVALAPGQSSLELAS